MYTDSHCHITCDRLYSRIEEIIENIQSKNVTSCMIMCTSPEELERAKRIKEKYPFFKVAFGWFPSDAKDVTDKEIQYLIDQTPYLDCLGEIGLDYYWDDVPSDKQKEIFQQQVDLAKKHQKPIIIHCRDAYEDTYEVLKRNGHPGIMHCYSGSVEMAKRFIDLGFYISLAGPVTFKNARVPKDVAEKIGLEHLLIETDCPYLTPHPYRGSLNEPANVVYIAQEIAKLKNMEIESVASQTTFNAKKVFGIK